MHVIEVTAFGDPSGLAIADRPEPVGTPGHVRVRVSAADIHPADVGTIAGAFAGYLPDLQPPFVLGWDVVGTVIDGEGFTPGTRVAGMIPWFAQGGRVGALADVVDLEPSWLVPVPDGIDDATASTVPLNAQTAAQALEILAAQPAETVLVTGASGAVGAFATQLLVAAGVHVIAIASAGDEAFVASLGAKEVIARTPGLDIGRAVRELIPEGVDAAFDPGSVADPLLRAIRDGGRYVAAAGSPSQTERDIVLGRISVEPRAEQLASLFARVADGSLVTRVAAVLPAAEFAEGFRRTAAGGERGKIVFTFPI